MLFGFQFGWPKSTIGDVKLTYLWGVTSRQIGSSLLLDGWEILRDGTVDGSEIRLTHQLRLVNLPLLTGFYAIPGGWPWDFWTINSMFILSSTPCTVEVEHGFTWNCHPLRFWTWLLPLIFRWKNRQTLWFQHKFWSANARVEFLLDFFQSPHITTPENSHFWNPK